jgi:sugar lactone lactonase YvrE
VFLADAVNNRVVEVTTGSGRKVLPFSGLASPQGIAVDRFGNVFVADTNNNRVVLLGSGSGSQAVLPLQGLRRPYGVAVDGLGNVFVADTFNNRVVELPKDRKEVVVPIVGLVLPYGVAVDAGGDVFVADSANGRVVVVARDGTQATVGFKNLVFPLAVAVDAAGDVFVTDTYSSRVIELPQGGAQATLGFHGLNRPRRIAVDGPGDVFAVETDDNQVLKLPVNEATFVYPTNGQVGADGTQPFVWSPIPGAQAYDLVIGTTPRGSDLFNSGVLPASQSSISVPPLPFGQTLYATILTEISGAFSSFQGISFSVAPLGASFTYPKDGDTDVDTTKLFTWTKVQGAQGYFVAIGTTPNGSDVLNSGILPASQQSLDVGALPTGKTLYARVLTEANGVLSPAQGITITAALGQAVFTYPLNGQTAVDATRPFTWSTVPHAEGYILAIGTTVFGTDILDSPAMPPTQSSLKVPTLVSGRTLYATLLTKVNGVFSRSTSVGFTVR